MKTLRYPKTYAKLIEIKKVNERPYGWPYYVNICIYEIMRRDPRYKDIFVGTGEIIEVRNPGRSGHTPRNAEREVVEIIEKVGRKRKMRRVCYKVKMVGKVFKLYQRPQDNGRWMYRWMGQ